MLRKLIQAGAVVMVFTGNAYCQVGGAANTSSNSMSLGIPTGGERRLSPEEAQRENELESKYRETLNKIPDKKAASDPWGNVRSAPAKTSPTAKHRQP